MPAAHVYRITEGFNAVAANYQIKPQKSVGLPNNPPIVPKEPGSNKPLR